MAGSTWPAVPPPARTTEIPRSRALRVTWCSHRPRTVTRNADLPVCEPDGPDCAGQHPDGRTYPIAGRLHDALSAVPAGRRGWRLALLARRSALRSGFAAGLARRCRVGPQAVAQHLGAGRHVGSGSGSRSSRLTRSSRPARSAATASGSCRAAFAMMPIMKSVVAVDVPPAEISGSCRPVTGSRPTT